MGQDKTMKSPEEMVALIWENSAAGCIAVLGCGTNLLQLVIGLGIRPVAAALDTCLER